MAHSSLESLAAHVASLKAAGKRVVFTNGVFDILHVGHVTYLEAAKAKGDLLIVGVNDDASVRKLNKGPERPINGEAARAKVISSLKSVDEVVIFGEDTPYDLINLLKPNVLVKGGNYDPEERDPASKTYLVGSDLVRAEKGEVAAIPLVEGFSTTSIVRKLKG